MSEKRGGEEQECGCHSAQAEPRGQEPSGEQGEESKPAIAREGRRESQTDQTLLQFQCPSARSWLKLNNWNIRLEAFFPPEKQGCAAFQEWHRIWPLLVYDPSHSCHEVAPLHNLQKKQIKTGQPIPASLPLKKSA